MERLNKKQIITNLKDNPKWERVDTKSIGRKYQFKSFLIGIHFVDKIAIYAEDKNHHPFISIDYNVVMLRVSVMGSRRTDKLRLRNGCSF